MKPQSQRCRLPSKVASARRKGGKFLGQLSALFAGFLNRFNCLRIRTTLCFAGILLASPTLVLGTEWVQPLRFVSPTNYPMIPFGGPLTITLESSLDSTVYREVTVTAACSDGTTPTLGVLRQPPYTLVLTNVPWGGAKLMATARGADVPEIRAQPVRIWYPCFIDFTFPREGAVILGPVSFTVEGTIYSPWPGGFILASSVDDAEFRIASAPFVDPPVYFVYPREGITASTWLPGHHTVAARLCEGFQAWDRCSSPASLSFTIVPAEDKRDRDQDGMPDVWEEACGLNPDSPADAEEDLDHDGVRNLAEYQAGTDPKDPGSRVSLSASVVHEDTYISLTGAPGRRYQFQSADDPAQGLWRDLDQRMAPTTVCPRVLGWLPADGISKFFRVKQVD